MNVWKCRRCCTMFCRKASAGGMRSQESPSTSSRLMAIRKLSALWLVYCYHNLRFECLSKPSLVRGDQQYGAIPQSATTFGRSCKVYTSSSTSKVREDWAVLLPWYENIRPSNERLIVDHCYFELADYPVDNRMTLSGMIWGAGGYPIWSNRKANTDRPGSDSRYS
jgi:hypothetical protein